MKIGKSVEAHLVLSSLDPKLASLSREKIRNADVIIVEHIWSSFFPIFYARLFNKPLVLVDHNAETALSRQFLKKARSPITKILLSLRLVYTLFLEKYACEKSDIVVTLSQNDIFSIKKTFRISDDKFKIIPPSIDTKKLKNNPSIGLKKRKKLGIPNDCSVVCFLGDLTTIPNLTAVKHIINHIAPNVLSKLPKTVFLIIGRYKKNIPFQEKTNIIFTNEVSNLKPFLSATDICIAPLTLGSGVKLKVLTYMAFSKPVISTPIGIEGINAKNGEDAIICSLENFQSEILRLASDIKLRFKIGRKGRKLIEDNYDKEVVSQRFAMIMNEVKH
jgi:glycosyltransferase involved in cell wall biosynthesis